MGWKITTDLMLTDALCQAGCSHIDCLELNDTHPYGILPTYYKLVHKSDGKEMKDEYLKLCLWKRLAKENTYFDRGNIQSRIALITKRMYVKMGKRFLKAELLDRRELYCFEYHGKEITWSYIYNMEFFHYQDWLKFMIIEKNDEILNNENETISFYRSDIIRSQAYYYRFRRIKRLCGKVIKNKLTNWQNALWKPPHGVLARKYVEASSIKN